MQKINYEEWGKIRFRPDHALFADGPGRFPVTFFHLGLFFQKAVDMYAVENGQARKIVYDQSYFDMPADSVAHGLPQGAGFAGLRIQEARDGALDWRKNDWVAFLGAAYFRAIGELQAIRPVGARHCARRRGRRPARRSSPTSPTSISTRRRATTRSSLYALMEGPSIVGAYRFAMKRGKGVIDGHRGDAVRARRRSRASASRR